MMDNLNKTSASRPEKQNAQQGKINPVNRSRVSDQILVQLTNLILDGTYPPGSKLPPERQLAMQFEVNRASLREALRRLESMGMIYVRQGGGIYVQDYNSHSGLGFVSFLLENGMQLDFSLIRDLAEMRILFGKIMITLAAERMNAESLCALEAILEQIRGAGPTERQSGDLDFAWYHQLALATQNRIFVFILNTIREVMRKVISIYFQVENNLQSSINLYQNLLAALRVGDTEHALRLFEEQARHDDALLPMVFADVT